MYYVGVDYHKRYSVATVVNSDGEMLARQRHKEGAAGNDSCVLGVLVVQSRSLGRTGPGLAAATSGSDEG